MSILTLSLVIALVVPTRAQQPPSLHVTRTLSGMRDHYRPLLIFAPTGDLRLHTQLDLLTIHRADLIDRQILLVPFSHKWAGPVDTAIMDFMSEDEPDIRRRFHISPSDFTVILLGKDGGEKFRSPKPVAIDQLIRVIDAMPMRQTELRDRHKD